MKEENNIGAPSDIWSIGVIMMEVISKSSLVNEIPQIRPRSEAFRIKINELKLKE